MFRSAAGSAGDAAGRAGGASAGRAGGDSSGSSIPEGVSTGRPGGASAGSSKPEGVSYGPPNFPQVMLALITSRLVFTAWRSVRSGDDPALTMTHSCGSTMDNSRAFRHELLLRVMRAKRGTEPFRPLCNTTNDLLICSSPDFPAMPVVSDPLDPIRAILIRYEHGLIGPSGADQEVMDILRTKGYVSQKVIKPMLVGIHHLNRGGVIGASQGMHKS